MPRGRTKKAREESVNQSLESTLWAAADKLRGHLDAADYKQTVLGLIFLKYISDRFTVRRDQILQEDVGADPEDRDEYTAEGVFWVPASSRWGGGEVITITPKELRALMDGKLLALDVEGEYVVYLQLDEDSGD